MSTSVKSLHVILFRFCEEKYLKFAILTRHECAIVPWCDVNYFIYRKVKVPRSLKSWGGGLMFRANNTMRIVMYSFMLHCIVLSCRTMQCTLLLSIWLYYNPIYRTMQCNMNEYIKFSSWRRRMKMMPMSYYLTLQKSKFKSPFWYLLNFIIIFSTPFVMLYLLFHVCNTSMYYMYIIQKA